MIYYNDNEPFVVKWLENLTIARQLPKGKIDSRPIDQVCPEDLKGYKRCHFFAGIGGWEYALGLAGWPSEVEVWTGSCPCQPFSNAGKRKGNSDARHLWPVWFRLIRECQPATIFGEQVTSPLGRTWLAGVFADLEALGYACAGADLCAASCGAPHIRQRLFWVAHAERGAAERQRHHLAGAAQEIEGEAYQRQRIRDDVGDGGPIGGLGDTESEQTGRARQSWKDGVWLPCLDGKARRIEPGLEPLAYGLPARMGRLRGYGNAIVPQVAAVFIKAFLDSQPILD